MALDWKMWTSLWIVFFLVIIWARFLLKFPFFKNITPAMLILPLTIWVMQIVMIQTWYFSYMFIVLFSWLIIGIMFLVISTGSRYHWSVQKFWLQYWRYSGYAAIVLLFTVIVLSIGLFKAL